MAQTRTRDVEVISVECSSVSICVDSVEIIDFPIEEGNCVDAELDASSAASVESDFVKFLLGCLVVSFLIYHGILAHSPSGSGIFSGGGYSFPSGVALSIAMLDRHCLRLPESVWLQDYVLDAETEHGENTRRVEMSPSNQKPYNFSTYIPRKLVQTHVEWSDVEQDEYLNNTVAELRTRLAENGWEWEFFDNDGKQNFFESDPVMKNLMLIDTSGFARGSPEEKSAFRQLNTSADSAESKVELMKLQRSFGLRLVDRLKEGKELAASTANIKVVSMADLYNSLEKGVAQADFFRYAYIYVHGGVYLDTKSGIDRQSTVDDVIFGKVEADGTRPRQEMRMFLSRWHDCDWGPAGYVTPMHPKVANPAATEEIAQWFIAAQPRHRYLFRVLEEVSANIYLANRAGSFLGGAGAQYHREDRRWQVLMLTGPFAFTSAIAQETFKILTLPDKKRSRGMSCPFNMLKMPLLESFPSKQRQTGEEVLRELSNVPIPRHISEFGLDYSHLMDPKTYELIGGDWQNFKKKKFNYFQGKPLVTKNLLIGGTEKLVNFGKDPPRKQQHQNSVDFDKEPSQLAPFVPEPPQLPRSVPEPPVYRGKIPSGRLSQ